jgi:hypothetical protein
VVISQYAWQRQLKRLQASPSTAARTVLIVAVDRLAPISTRGDVIEPAGELDAEGSGHGGKNSSPNAGLQGLTPLRVNELEINSIARRADGCRLELFVVP